MHPELPGKGQDGMIYVPKKCNIPYTSMDINVLRFSWQRTNISKNC